MDDPADGIMKLSIVTKNILLFSGVILVFAAVTVYQISMMRESTRSLYEINFGHLPLSRIITQIDTAHKNQQSNAERAADVTETSGRRILTRLVLEYFPRLLRQQLVQGMAHCHKLSLVTRDGSVKAFYAEVREKLQEIGRLNDVYLKKAGVYFAAMENEGQDVKTALSDFRAAEREFTRAIKVLSLRLDNEIGRNVQQVEKQGDNAVWAGIIFSASAFLAAVLLTILSVYLLKPLRRLTEAAQRIGRGDYRVAVPIQSGDEMGTLAHEFEHMRQSILQRDRVLTEQAEKLERSNNEMRTLKVHYENIINNLWLPVLVVDEQLRVRTVNPGAVKLWGGEGGDPVGRQAGDLPLVKGCLRDILPFESVLEEKRIVVREAVKIEGTDGRIHQISLTAVPFLDEGKVRGMLILGEDVTEELRMRNSMLQSERLAAIGRISAKIAHEIRNPLSSIALNTEMLQEEFAGGAPDLEELLPILQSIVKEVERLYGITENHLKFARMPETERRPMNLVQVVANLVDFYRAELTQRSVDCHLDLPENAVWVMADENQIVQVMHNLLKNAIEAMEEGGEIKLSVGSDGTRAGIYLRDSGSGVPEEIREKIFEPFFSTKDGGTGLGLALAKSILAEHDGELRLEGLPEGGSIVTLKLPLADDEKKELERD